MKRCILLFAAVLMMNVYVPAADGIFSGTVAAGEDLTLVRAGTGGLYKWFIKGADMALFLPEGTKKSDVLKDIPRCLDFYYHHSIKAGQFAYAAWDTLKKNHSSEELEANRAAIDMLHALYRDVAPGDRYRLLYVPGAGTKLFLNGELLGVVPGAGFSSVYYGVWLGAVPLDARLKHNLLKPME